MHYGYPNSVNNSQPITHITAKAINRYSGSILPKSIIGGLVRANYAFGQESRQIRVTTGLFLLVTSMLLT